MVTMQAVRDELASFATSFDPLSLTPTQAADALTHVSAIKATAALLEGLLAKRANETGAWRRAGQPTPAHHVAQQTGESLGRARQLLDTAEQLAELPVVAAAAARGDLSQTQTTLIASAASKVPTAEKHLVRLAGRVSVGELKKECLQVKARATDPQAQWERFNDERSLRHWVDDEGRGHLHYSDNPEQVAKAVAKLAPSRERLFQTARREGRTVPSEALDADAFLATLCGTDTTSARVGRRQSLNTSGEILVRVDLDTLLRGFPTEDEVCEIPGLGPIAPKAVEDMAASGSFFLSAIVTRGVTPVGVLNFGRRPTTPQWTLLKWLSPTCAREGCNRGKRLQGDHERDWSKTKITLVEWLDGLCEHDHDLKTHQHWALLEGTGKRPMVPPDDPRHPKNKPRPTRQIALRPRTA